MDFDSSFIATFGTTVFSRVDFDVSSRYFARGIYLVSGYGLPPEQPAVGIILAESMTYLSSGMWWMAVFPGVVLVLMVWLIDRLGEQLRRVIDPFYAQE